MSREAETTGPEQDNRGRALPMRDLGFSILSLLIETAAANLRLESPVVLTPSGEGNANLPDLAEAKLAIDAANVLLDNLRSVMESEARLAIEGMLTQLQIEYVTRSSQRR